ncbi:MAG: type II toxin-antitoxin system RelB/DinJ family antitoxin [Coriobacteriia bacterium]|nr:type II toxin-antitoxin system RelB/DinJ family antitoxin [Coriobacteriia bacterium]
MPATATRKTEGKFRTSADIKERATEVYSKWGLSLSDAINVFLVKSVEVGGLPFEMRPEMPSHSQIASMAYHAPIDSNGVAILPADWDDYDE